jgi:hypothetical protein
LASSPVVLRATADRLLTHLLEATSDDDVTFVQDFLLTFKTFLPSSAFLMNRLVEAFHDLRLRDKVRDAIDAKVH